MTKFCAWLPFTLWIALLASCAMVPETGRKQFNRHDRQRAAVRHPEFS
jgi:hypothetical protein